MLRNILSFEESSGGFSIAVAEPLAEDSEADEGADEAGSVSDGPEEAEVMVRIYSKGSEAKNGTRLKGQGTDPRCFCGGCWGCLCVARRQVRGASLVTFYPPIRPIRVLLVVQRG
jgi:hypothetical protein